MVQTVRLTDAVWEVRINKLAEDAFDYSVEFFHPIPFKYLMQNIQKKLILTETPCYTIDQTQRTTKQAKPAWSSSM